MKDALLWGLAVLLVTGCGERGGSMQRMLPEIPGSNSYATGFEITRAGNTKMLTVRDPWQRSRDVTFSYLLAGKGESVPDTLSKLPRIDIPVNRVVALSTTHLAMIETIGQGRTIRGVSGADLVYSRTLRDRIRSGEVVDVGYDDGLNYEAIVSLDPDVLFIYGIGSSARMVSDRLSDLGVPVVFCGEYLEGHPLGKAEWIRFFACFYGMEREADRIFHRVDSAYGILCDLARGVELRPGVLTGLPWNDTWFMAGGQSFAARLIRDAGGEYLWSGNPSKEAVPLDLESVFVRAVAAQVWINPGSAGSLMELEATDERFAYLPVVLSGEVYNNNARVRSTGANDYWESATVRPDLVLADLIEIFHPRLQTDHHLIYYRKLK